MAYWFNVETRQVELLVVVSCWYLFLTSILSIPQYYLERHYGRGGPGAESLTLLQRIRRGVAARHDEIATGDAGPPTTFSGHNR